MPDVYRLLAVAAYTAYQNSLVGNAAPAVADYYARVTHPVVGDLVLETTTITKDPWPTGALGWLRAVREEPVQSEEQHEKMLADGDFWHHEGEGHDAIPTERVTYVVALDLDAVEPETRWTNANFISLPIDHRLGEAQFTPPREEQTK